MVQDMESTKRSIMSFIPGRQVRVGEERPPEGHSVVARAQLALSEVLLLVVAVVGNDDTIKHFPDTPVVLVSAAWLFAFALATVYGTCYRRLLPTDNRRRAQNSKHDRYAEQCQN